MSKIRIVKKQKAKERRKMKVLAISASPRKGGNSDVLCDQFLKGAAEVGNVVKKINLAGMNISPCIACYGCTKSHQCVKNDEM